MKTNKTNEAIASTATKVANVTETTNSTANGEVTNQETPKKEKKLKKVKKHHTEETQDKVNLKKVKKSKKEAAVEDTVKAQKASLKEAVISHREVKYKYPEDVNDVISRKAWRAKVRAKLDSLEKAVYRIKDQNSKEYKKAQKEYNEYRSKVLKSA